MIKGLTDRGMSFPEIGSIRKGGAKDPAKNQPGKDLQYFRVDVDDDEEKRYHTLTKLTGLYGDNPTALTIILPFDDIDRVWDAWREKYNAGALIHRCDGEMVRYSINPQTGERVVINGLRVDNGQPQPCQISTLPKPQCCVPVGRLKVIIPALNRLAYFVVHTTSIHDIISISEQLEAIRGLNGGHIAGVPLVLKRVPRNISTPSGDNGKRARRVKWLISIEADPSWVEQKVLALNSAAMPQIESRRPLPLNTGTDFAELEDYDDDDIPASYEIADEETTPPYRPEPIESQHELPAPIPPSATAAPNPRPMFKKASVKFGVMTPDEWHQKIDSFAAQHPNWQKGGRADPDHILISAAYAGYQFVTGDNVEEVLAAIVAAHEAKQAQA